MAASDRDLQEQLHLLHVELEALAERLTQVQLDVRGETDAIRIELETLRRFLKRQHPHFAEVYTRLRESVVQAVDPEFPR